jgi:hypothetical protein
MNLVPKGQVETSVLSAALSLLETSSLEHHRMQ